jgi:hypothetical protein
MPKVVRPLTERSKAIDDKLPQCADALNQAILEAETHLKALRPIEEVWYGYDADVDRSGEPHMIYSVGFAKVTGRWRLLHSEQAPGNPEGATRSFLTDESLETRVCAAEHVPKLRELIVQTKEGFITKVNDVISKLKSLGPSE